MDLMMAVVVLGLVAFMCFCLGAIFGWGFCERSAIRAGVARYTVDPKTGETTFEWVNPDR